MFVRSINTLGISTNAEHKKLTNTPLRKIISTLKDLWQHFLNKLNALFNIKAPEDISFNSISTVELENLDNNIEDGVFGFMLHETFHR